MEIKTPAAIAKAALQESETAALIGCDIAATRILATALLAIQERRPWQRPHVFGGHQPFDNQNAGTGRKRRGGLRGRPRG